eukprot:g15191.t1
MSGEGSWWSSAAAQYTTTPPPLSADYFRQIFHVLVTSLFVNLPTNFWETYRASQQQVEIFILHLPGWIVYAWELYLTSARFAGLRTFLEVVLPLCFSHAVVAGVLLYAYVSLRAAYGGGSGGGRGGQEGEEDEETTWRKKLKVSFSPSLGDFPEKFSLMHMCRKVKWECFPDLAHLLGPEPTTLKASLSLNPGRMHLLRRIGRYILWRVVFLLLWLLELLFKVNLTKVELADANCCWLLPTSYLCGKRQKFLGAKKKVEKPQAAFFSGYLEFHLLPSFLKIPFFAVQLPAAIVPQLGSAHLKEFVRRREVEDLLLSTSVRNGKGEKRKRNTSSLINRIDLSKVPVKTVLTQAFEMAKNWDVKLDCSVFYPETCDVWSFLPDSSTLHVSCSSSAQRGSDGNTSNNGTTTTNNKVTQYLFDTLDQHEAEENVEIDEQNADIVRAYVGRRLKKKQQLLKERTRMIGLMKRLEISCDLNLDRPFCLDLLGRSAPSSSSLSSSKNLLDFTYYREGMVGKMAGGLKVSQFTIQSMRYKTESLWKFGSKSRNFLRIPQELNCEFGLKRLMICDIFLDDGTSEIQIATEPADVKIKGRCSCSPAGSGEEVVGTPGTINGDPPPPAPKNAVVWEIGLDKLDRSSRLRPSGEKEMQDENLLGFELLGVTRIAEDAEIPEFDFNLGEAIRTHLSGSWNLNFLASLSGGGVVGETSGPPVPEIDADPVATTSTGSVTAFGFGDGDRDLINLATMNGTTVEVILSQCGASLGGRLLYLDGGQGAQQTAEDFSEMVLFGDDGGSDPLRVFEDVLPPLLSGGAATDERKEVGLSGDGAQSGDIRLPLPSQPSSAISGATASARDEDKNHDGDQVALAACDKNLNHASDEAISRDNLIRRLRRQRNNPDYIDVLSDVFFAGYVGDRSEAGENTTRAHGSSVRAGVDGLFSDEESDSGETDKSWASTEEGGGVLELCAASPVADAVRPQPRPSASKAGERPGAGSSAHKKALRASDNILVTGQRRSRSQKQQQVKVSSASSPLEPPSSGVSSGTIGSTSSKGPTTSSTSTLRLPTSRRGGLILYSEESQMGVNLLPTFFAKGELIGHLSSVGKLSVKKFLPWEFDRSADCSGHTPPSVVESRTSTAEPIPLSFPPTLLSNSSVPFPGSCTTGGDQDNDLPEQPVRKSTAAIIRSLASFYEDGLRQSKNLRASNADQYVGGGGRRSGGAATAEEEDEGIDAAESEKLDSLDRCVSLGGGVLGQHQLTGEAEAEPEPLVAGDGSSWWRPTSDAAAGRATAEQVDTSNGTGTGTSDKPPSATPSPESVLSDVHALAWSSPLKFLYLSEFQKKRITALCKAVSKEQMESKNHLKSVKENKLELPWHVVSHWLQNDGIIAGVFTILGILGSPRLFNWATDAFDELQRVVGILDRLNIQKASDLIPVDKLIEFLYLVLNIQEEVDVDVRGRVAEVDLERDRNNLLNQQKSSSHVVPPAVNGIDGPKQVRASGSAAPGGQLQHHLQAQGRAGGAGTALLDDQAAADNQPYWKRQLTRFIRKLIRGEGVDITIAKNILSKAYPQWYDHWMVEIDRSLRIVNKIAIPMPMPPIAVSDSKSAAGTSPLHLDRLVPTAKELYNLCSSSSSSQPGVEAQAITARRASGALLAPYMNRTQLAYLLKHGCFENVADEKVDRRRLSYILHLKQTLAQIVDDIGGNSLLPQTHGIAFLLGDTLARSQSSGSQLHQQHRSQFGTSLLGPADMAGLLRAILSNMNMTHFAQRALRLLLDILSTQPKIYVRGVFYELSLNGSQRVLSGLLMRLLDAPQTCFSVSNQIDRTQKLREILGLEEGLEGGGGSSTFHLPLPRRADYLAGGKLQRRSYYEAIYRIAATLIDESDEYLQLKQRLTVCSGEDEKQKSSTSSRIPGAEAVAVEQEEKNYRDAEFERLVAHARKAIAAADAAGSAWLEAVVGADAVDAGGKLEKTVVLEPFASCKLRKAAIAKYADAFKCCRRVVKKSNKKALFRCSWLKDFYERNYESLVIFYTAKNIIEDTDAVASWLVNQPWEVVCGGKRASGPRSATSAQHHGKKIGASPAAAFASTNASLKSGTAPSSAPGIATAPPQQSEVAALVRRLQRSEGAVASGCQDQLDHLNLVRLIIAATYFYTEDHEATLTDPLNYLLFDFENDSTERTGQRPQGHPHHLDLSHFTLLTAMGVITEGEKGREMENSFKRLTRKHGVKVVRSHTGTARHLEYNAGQIQKALKQALSEQPTNYWGWLGYSQGCANCWKAETELNTGTPDQQKLLQKLVCRNSLFSAANGTPQVTVLEWRISECGADLEMLLKSIQLHVSQNLNSFLLSALSFLLSSREFVFAIGGLHSLNHLGTIRGLWRGARMKENVPSLAVRAVGDGETLPECLVFISNILWTEAMHVPQDKLKKGGGGGVGGGGGGGGGSGASSEVQKSCSSSLAGVDGGGGLLLGKRTDFDASVPAASEGNEKKNPPQPTSGSRSRAGSGSSNVSPFRSGPIGSPIGSSPGSGLVPRIGLGAPPSFVQVKPFGSFPSLGSTSPRGVGIGTPGVAASQMPGPPLPPKQKPGQLANSSSPPAADEHCYNRKNPIAALCNIPQELKAGSNHDSQVTAFEAEPYPVYMSTEKAPNISAGPDLVSYVFSNRRVRWRLPIKAEAL